MRRVSLILLTLAALVSECYAEGTPRAAPKKPEQPVCLLKDDVCLSDAGKDALKGVTLGGIGKFGFGVLEQQYVATDETLKLKLTIAVGEPRAERITARFAKAFRSPVAKRIVRIGSLLALAGAGASFFTFAGNAFADEAAVVNDGPVVYKSDSVSKRLDLPQIGESIADR